MTKSGFLRLFLATLVPAMLFWLGWCVWDARGNDDGPSLGGVGLKEKMHAKTSDTQHLQTQQTPREKVEVDEEAERLFEMSKYSDSRKSAAKSGSVFFHRVGKLIENATRESISSVCAKETDDVDREGKSRSDPDRGVLMFDAVEKAGRMMFDEHRRVRTAEISQILSARDAGSLVENKFVDRDTATDALARAFIYNLLKTRHSEKQYYPTIITTKSLVNENKSWILRYQQSLSKKEYSDFMVIKMAEDVGGPFRVYVHEAVCQEIYMTGQMIEDPLFLSKIKAESSASPRPKAVNLPDVGRMSSEVADSLFNSSPKVSSSNSQGFTFITGLDFFRLLRAFLDGMQLQTLSTICNKEYRSRIDKPRRALCMDAALKKTKEILFNSPSVGDDVNAILSSEEVLEYGVWENDDEASAALARTFIRRLLKGTFDMTSEQINDIPKFSLNGYKDDPDIVLHVGKIWNCVGDKADSTIRVATKDGLFLHIYILHYLYLETYLTSRLIPDEEAGSAYVSEPSDAPSPSASSIGSSAGGFETVNLEKEDPNPSARDTGEHLAGTESPEADSGAREGAGSLASPTESFAMPEAAEMSASPVLAANPEAGMLETRVAGKPENTESSQSQ